MELEKQEAKGLTTHFFHIASGLLHVVSLSRLWYGGLRAFGLLTQQLRASVLVNRVEAVSPFMTQWKSHVVSSLLRSIDYK